MFRDEFIPSEENHTYEFPKELYGKKVVIASDEKTEDLGEKLITLGDILPKNSPNYDFWKDMPYDPNFPSIEEIRKTAWPDLGE